MTDHHRDRGAGREPAEIERANEFADLMDCVTATSDRFGHREHIHLTWLAVRRHGTAKATELVSDGIRRAARDAGAPRKYNATVSRAWVEIVGHHTDASTADEFEAFARENPGLLEKELLGHFYTESTLASERARTNWIEPDRRPFPWR